jgi:non-specific serine/threonine protein kinase/serine/threonine-protein kinase
MSDRPTGTTGRRLSAEDHALVEDIFSAALELAAIDRAALVAARAQGRTAILDEVTELLAAHDRADSFLPSGTRNLVGDAPDPLTSSIVGQYRILEKIGEGGMGDVYRAERADGLFEHSVAIKIVRTSLHAADAMRRFLAERQILASLQHPNIVTLLDAGATSAGQPYIVMELIDGAPLNACCREKHLPLEARLRLFVHVCRAVQYAHQRGIVHRDLKPANILVTDEGVPKVLDFGIAKLLETSAEHAATLTGLFPGPLTPNYASPEQLRGLPVTTACDVYSLGILLYEIAAGVRPYDTTGQTLDHVLEMVLRTDVARPSDARIVDDRASAWRSRLRGDLDSITLKAIAKEPESRYGSAGELADDLERYLEGQPVNAREPSAIYMLRRLASRNRAAVTIGMASFLLVLAALGVALWQRHEARLAQARAEQRFREVRQLADALIFKIHDAVAPLPGSTPVRQTIVNEALAYLERLGEETRDDDSLRVELSNAYRQVGRILGDPQTPNLGNRPAAIAQFERARGLALPLASRPHPVSEAVAALVNVDRLLASVLALQGERTRAVQFAREALAVSERWVHDVPSNAMARDLRAKAAFDIAFTSRGEDALANWQRAAELFNAALAEKPDDPERQRNVALVEKYWGGLLDGLERDAEAEVHYARARALDEQRYARDPNSRRVQFDLAIDLSNSAGIAQGARRLDEAYALFSRSLEMRQKLWASDPRDVMTKGRVGYVRTRLALIEVERGHSAAALEHAKVAVAMLQSVADQTADALIRRELGAALAALARAQAAAGQRVTACASLERARRVFQSLTTEREKTDEDEMVARMIRGCQAGRDGDRKGEKGSG